MKNTRLKNVIFTAGMAIFTGVLLLGVNAAIGAATPTVDPPGAGVSPTFTGLNVTGNIQNSSDNNEGGVIVDDSLQITGSTWIDDLIVQGVSTFDGAVTIDGDFESRGGNFRGVIGNSDGDLYVDDNMTIDGTLNLTGNLSDNFGSLTVADDFVVTGTSDLRGNVTFNGNIASDKDTLLVNDMLRVGGGLLVDGPGSRIDGDYINVNAVLRANESIINSGDDPVLIDDDLTISNGRTLLNQGNMETWDYAGFAGDIHMDLYGSEDGDILGVDDIQLHGEISNPVPNADVVIADGLDVHGTIKNTSTTPPAGSLPRPVTIDDNLVVTGVARASRFGTYDSRMQSTGTVIPIGRSATALSMACPAGQTLVSCGIDTNGNNMDVLRLYPWDSNTCYAHVRNTDTVNRRAWLITMCLDPDA